MTFTVDPLAVGFMLGVVSTLLFFIVLAVIFRKK